MKLLDYLKRRHRIHRAWKRKKTLFEKIVKSKRKGLDFEIKESDLVDAHSFTSRLFSDLPEQSEDEENNPPLA